MPKKYYFKREGVRKQFGLKGGIFAKPILGLLWRSFVFAQSFTCQTGSKEEEFIVSPYLEHLGFEWKIAGDCQPHAHRKGEVSKAGSGRRNGKWMAAP